MGLVTTVLLMNEDRALTVATFGASAIIDVYSLAGVGVS